MSVGRDPRVDIILAQLHDGEISRDFALKALVNIGLEQFDEDYEYGNASKARPTYTQRFKARARKAVRRPTELRTYEAQES